MSSFTDELLLVQTLADWRLWRVERPFVYEVGVLDSGRTIQVPRGFLTDGASIPRLLWPWLPPCGRYLRAAAVHDYLCWRLHHGAPHPEAPDRTRADAIFWEAVRVCGSNRLTAALLWAGVRLGALLYRLDPQLLNIVDQVNLRDPHAEV